MPTSMAPASVAYGPFDAAAGLTLCIHLVIHDDDGPGSSPPLQSRPARPAILTAAFAATVERGRQLLQALGRGAPAPPGQPSEPRAASPRGWSIGWFGDARLRAVEHAFALWAGKRACVTVRLASRGRPLSAPLPVAAVPLCYMICLRRRGAAYYLPAAPSAPALVMRPVAIDAKAARPRFAAVRREDGGSSAAVVRAVFVRNVPAFASWFGSAHFADRLVGTGDLHHSMAEIGGIWHVAEGRLRRAGQGVRGSAICNRAMASPREPSGLVHVEVDDDERQARVVLFFRHLDDDNCWRFVLRQRTARLSLLLGGHLSNVFTSRLPASGLAAGRRSLEIVDDGLGIVVSVDGLPAHRPIRDDRLAGAVGLGFATLGAGRHLYLRNIEAHPRTVPLPAEFVLPEPLA